MTTRKLRAVLTHAHGGRKLVVKRVDIFTKYADNTTKGLTKDEVRRAAN